MYLNSLVYLHEKTFCDDTSDVKLHLNQITNHIMLHVWLPQCTHTKVSTL